ncbi:MAG: 50S ribosomal protein L21 [Armatimonadetes bacterium]|nr:50S ribosomal protein L21 [Armatimonadota bacterium]
MHAVIRTGGKQYRVEENSVVEVEKLPLSVGEPFETDQVLLVSDESGVQVGTPMVANARVHGTVVAQDKRRRISGLRFKPKKNYLKRYGHRQPITRIRIERIEA